MSPSQVNVPRIDSQRRVRWLTFLSLSPHATERFIAGPRATKRHEPRVQRAVSIRCRGGGMDFFSPFASCGISGYVLISGSRASERASEQRDWWWFRDVALCLFGWARYRKWSEEKLFDGFERRFAVGYSVRWFRSNCKFDGSFFLS